MMAVIYIVLVLATGGLYWLLGTRRIDEIFSVYDVWFFGAMLVTTFAVARNPDAARAKALGVLWLIYATHWANDFADLPESTAAIANTAVSAWFILTMRERWEWLCALCFALMPFAAWFAEIGLWPGYDECSPGFMPMCGPFAVFVLGLLAVMSLGLASDDGGGIRARDGRFIRSWLARPSPILGLARRGSA